MVFRQLGTMVEVAIGAEPAGTTTLNWAKLTYEGKEITATNGTGYTIKAVECFPFGSTGIVREQVRVTVTPKGSTDEDEEIYLMPKTRGGIFANIREYENAPSHNPKVVLGKDRLKEMLDEHLDGDEYARYGQPEVTRKRKKTKKR